MLKELGFKIIELADLDEAKKIMALNMVPLAPNCMLTPAGNMRMQHVLEENVVECHSVDVSKLMKGCSSAHCLSDILLHDLI